MSRVLLCSSDPLVFRHLYGILRDEGFAIDLAGHAAAAVRMSFETEYVAIVLDAECVGLPAMDAARIIRDVRPKTRVIVAGDGSSSVHAVTVPRPPDARVIRRTVLAACGNP